MLLNFKKSMSLLKGLTNLTLFFFIFLFHPSILSLLRIEFHNLFHFAFYEIIIILKKISILV